MIKIKPFQPFEENKVYYFEYFHGSGRMNTMLDIIQAVVDHNKFIIIFDFEDLPFKEIFQNKNLEFYQNKIILFKAPSKYGVSKDILHYLSNIDPSIKNLSVILIPSLNLFSNYYSSENPVSLTEYKMNEDIVLRKLEELSKRYTIIIGK